MTSKSAPAREWVRVQCGTESGKLDPGRFGPAGRSLCIRADTGSDNDWMSPIEFEHHGGKGSQHNWKRTIRSLSHDNRALIWLIDDGVLKICADKNCTCYACQLPKLAGVVGKKVSGSKDDNDSDSGISVEILSPEPVESAGVHVVQSGPMSAAEQDEVVAHDYTSMVQEAIFALTSSESPDGCSKLGVILYILHNHRPTESVSVVHAKIRATLRLLQRMGVVDRVDNDVDSDDGDNDDEGEGFKAAATPEKRPEAPPKKAGVELAAAAKKVKKAARVLQQKKIKENKKKVVAGAAAKKGKKEAGKENKVKAATPFPHHFRTPKRLSPALSALCGGKKQLSRHEAVRGIWLYIKGQNLQDPKQRTLIVCDEKLRAVTKKKTIMCSEVLAYLGQNMTPITNKK